MTIQKFKTYQEAKEALWCFNPDAIYYQSLRDFWETSARLKPLKLYSHGITRFQSTRKAAQQLDEWLSDPTHL